MKRLLVLGLLLAFGLLPLGCSRELGVEPTAQRDASSVAGTTLDSRSAAMEIVQASGWDQDPDAWAEVAAEASSSEATVQRSPALIADLSQAHS